MNLLLRGYCFGVVINLPCVDVFLPTSCLAIVCRTVRAISSDRGKVVSGSDDQSVLVWDKQTTQLLEELKGHDAQVCCLWVHCCFVIK